MHSSLVRNWDSFAPSRLLVVDSQGRESLLSLNSAGKAKVETHDRNAPVGRGSPVWVFPGFVCHTVSTPGRERSMRGIAQPSLLRSGLLGSCRHLRDMSTGHFSSPERLQKLELVEPVLQPPENHSL